MVEYFSFDDVLGELQLNEEDLKRMVSEGELRAFRDENKMKFRKDDVENLKKGLRTEPTVVLPPSSAPAGEDSAADVGLESADTLLTPEPAGDILAPEADAEPAAADEGLGGLDLAPAVADAGETVAGETTGITEQMVFDDTDLTVSADDTAATAIDSQDTFVEDEEAARTEPLAISEEGGAAEEEGEAVGPRVGARRGMGAVAAPVKPQAHPVVNVALFIGIVALVLAFFIGMDIARIGQSDDAYNSPTGITKELSSAIKGALGPEKTGAE
ncbi:MAG: hypothetical protein RDV41_01685 [Planctomycetota bacterium]|nr:hypothetical protein [Planctomycetota bacterium]